MSGFPAFLAGGFALRVVKGIHQCPGLGAEMTGKSHDSAPTRRNVLGFACAGGVAALSGTASAAPLRWLDSGTGTAAAGPLGAAAFATWAEMVGQHFVLAGSGARLELVAVEPAAMGGTAPAVGRSQAFAAIFAAKGPVAPEGDTIYRLDSPRLPSLDLYLGARVGKGAGAQFVAMFN